VDGIAALIARQVAFAAGKLLLHFGLRSGIATHRLRRRVAQGSQKSGFPATSAEKPNAAFVTRHILVAGGDELWPF
jgi:hypothetical protein